MVRAALHGTLEASMEEYGASVFMAWAAGTMRVILVAG